MSFTIDEGEMFGLVGESGSGKSTTGRCILRLIEPTSGDVMFRGENVLRVLARSGCGWRAATCRSSSRIRIRRSTRACASATSSKSRWSFTSSARRPSARARVAELFQLVGLEPSHVARYPHEFSGGQRQRIGIARALALNPALVIADEAVSALDVSIQAQVVKLLLDLKDRLKLTYLFIAHDLRLVEHICSRVAVMYWERSSRLGETGALFAQPTHPYTKALLSAIPVLDPDAPRQRIELDPSSFEQDAPLKEIGAQHWAAV